MILNKLDILSKRKPDPSIIEEYIKRSWAVYREKFHNATYVNLSEYISRANQGIEPWEYTYSNIHSVPGIDSFLLNANQSFRTMLITDSYPRFSMFKNQMGLRNLYLLDVEGFHSHELRGLVPDLIIIHSKYLSSISFPVLYNMDHLRGRVPLIKFTDS